MEVPYGITSLFQNLLFVMFLTKTIDTVGKLPLFLWHGNAAIADVSEVSKPLRETCLILVQLCLWETHSKDLGNFVILVDDFMDIS